MEVEDRVQPAELTAGQGRGGTREDRKCCLPQSLIQLQRDGDGKRLHIGTAGWCSLCPHFPGGTQISKHMELLGTPQFISQPGLE